jgi:hypothetical protein
VKHFLNSLSHHTVRKFYEPTRESAPSRVPFRSLSQNTNAGTDEIEVRNPTAHLVENRFALAPRSPAWCPRDWAWDWAAPVRRPHCPARCPGPPPTCSRAPACASTRLQTSFAAARRRSPHRQGAQSRRWMAPGPAGWRAPTWPSPSRMRSSPWPWPQEGGRASEGVVDKKQQEALAGRRSLSLALSPLSNLLTSQPRRLFQHTFGTSLQAYFPMPTFLLAKCNPHMSPWDRLICLLTTIS